MESRIKLSTSKYHLHTQHFMHNQQEHCWDGQHIPLEVLPAVHNQQQDWRVLAGHTLQDLLPLAEHHILQESR